MLFNLGYSLLALLSLHAYGSVALPVVPVELESRADGIAQSTYDNLVRYAKFSSAAYQLVCPRPLGNTLVKSVSPLYTYYSYPPRLPVVSNPVEQGEHRGLRCSR